MNKLEIALLIVIGLIAVGIIITGLRWMSLSKKRTQSETVVENNAILAFTPEEIAKKLLFVFINTEFLFVALYLLIYVKSSGANLIAYVLLAVYIVGTIYNIIVNIRKFKTGGSL
ncbi:hypothetical protein QCD85_08890 [Paenibacillus sp. PsM32]|uniref:hypothetical protein n=1 Tax=unclassified Paenibacillus TaxID=185978 RepID=UPI002366AB5E|nr:MULTISPECIES: hypothetical protein [unclassified Paenibacillus]MDN4618210.1 hypothetical protein [Paenibacillus sp. PsM32]WDF48780.1 hypothetical protein PQ460_12180 [Paenibacillus sp. KACC 21273]